MTISNPRQVIDLLLNAMFCRSHPDRQQHSFIYNKPGGHPFVGEAGFEVNYDCRTLLRAALFVRRNAAAHMRALSVGDVEKSLTDFISDNFWIIGDEAWEGCFLGVGRAADAPFDLFVSEGVKARLADAIAESKIFREPRELTVFPLVVVRVEKDYECASFFLTNPKGLTLERLPSGYHSVDLQSEHFPPIPRWDGIRHSPTSWLGVWAGTKEVAKRNRAAILGAFALLPHKLERYQFTGRKLFGGLCTITERISFSLGDPHTPALGEDIVIQRADHSWLNVLSAKIVSNVNLDKRQMRALEYFYRAWVPDPTRRFPTLFAALDAIYGDAAQATQSIINAVGPVMGPAYNYDRLKLLLSLRASVIHGGAPNVYESNNYHLYYEKYEEDATRDLELIVARCVQAVVFDSLMHERPHTYAALIRERTGRDV